MLKWLPSLIMSCICVCENYSQHLNHSSLASSSVISSLITPLQPTASITLFCITSIVIFALKANSASLQGKLAFRRIALQNLLWLPIFGCVRHCYFRQWQSITWNHPNDFHKRKHIFVERIFREGTFCERFSISILNGLQGNKHRWSSQ